MMPFADYKDFADCVAQNQEKDDPEAYCATIKRQVEGEAFRHRDFQRIYNEFTHYYKDTVKAESEYYQWLKALSLDEQREYAQARESFQWAKHMLKFLREDKHNKYYKVLVGFPIQSMNGNVYSERDLLATTLSIKGKHPSLNHKDEFWFSPENPRNRWGNIPVVGARFEDGAAEAIIQVPKDMICPVCHGAKMTELIDSKRIVNVSLEGTCKTGEVGGACEGFEFGDPPFTLLTTDVLPGIPLARIKPLEHIMVEALQSSTKKRRKVKMQIKAKRKEAGLSDTNPKVEPATPPDKNMQCPEGKIWSDHKGGCVDIGEQEQKGGHRSLSPTPISTFDKTGTNTETVVGTPTAPDHQFMKSGPEYGHRGNPNPASLGITNERWNIYLKEQENSGWNGEGGMDACLTYMTDNEGIPEEDAKAICSALVGEAPTEQQEPCPEGQVRNPATGECEDKPPEEQQLVPEPKPKKPSLDLTEEPPALTPQGDIAAGDVPPPKEEPEYKDEEPPELVSKTDDPTKVEPPLELPPTPPPSADPESAPEAPEKLPHTKDLAKSVVHKAPVELLSAESHVARVKAEVEAKTARKQTAKWEEKYVGLYRKFYELTGRYNILDEMYGKAVANTEAIEQRRLQMQQQHTKDRGKLELELFQKKQKYEEQCGKVNDVQLQYQKLHTNYEKLRLDHNKLLDSSVDLNTRLTGTLQENLDLQQKVDHLEDKLQEARKKAKHIVRIK